MDGMLVQATIWAVAIILVYSIVARGLFAVTEPVRRMALDLAAELDAEDRFPEDDKWRISRALDDVHSTRSAWGILLAFLGVLITVVPFGRTINMNDDVPVDLRERYTRFIALWVIATVANSVAVTFFILLTALIAGAFSVSMGMLSRLVLNRRDGGDTHSDRHASA